MAAKISVLRRPWALLPEVHVTGLPAGGSAGCGGLGCCNWSVGHDY